MDLNTPVRYIPSPTKKKKARAASTYRAARRNAMKGKRVRQSRAERLKQGPAKYIERKE